MTAQQNHLSCKRLLLVAGGVDSLTVERRTEVQKTV